MEITLHNTQHVQVTLVETDQQDVHCVWCDSTESSTHLRVRGSTRGTIYCDVACAVTLLNTAGSFTSLAAEEDDSTLIDAAASRQRSVKLIDASTDVFEERYRSVETVCSGCGEPIQTDDDSAAVIQLHDTYSWVFFHCGCWQRVAEAIKNSLWDAAPSRTDKLLGDAL